MKVNRDEFLEQGYIILREVIPQDELERLRRSHEILVERQRAVWARERGPNDPPGGVWESGAQPRLSVGTMGAEHDEQTASAIEFWTHENIQGASSELLAEADVPVTEMLLMCNPVRDRGPAAWHRDFYPPLNAPLQAYADDILETGPRYVQWNLALYDDDVLYVVPGSHIRPNTDEENGPLGAMREHRYLVVYRPTSLPATVSPISCLSCIGVATTPLRDGAPCTADSLGSHTILT